MSIKFTCDDKATLIAYLYGEIDPPARQAVDDHLEQCDACAAEVSALGDVRSELGLWIPPEVELDFQIVKKSELPSSNVLRPARWWNTVPGWAQAAAAILVVAAGLSIANLQIKSGPEGFSVSTGWMASFDSDATSSARGALAQDRPSGDEWKTALISLEQQLRTEIRAAREEQPRVAASTSNGDAIDAATIRRVQQLINEAEQRHERELATRFVEFTSDMNMQRRADLMKISQGFDDYNGQLLRQRQMLNNVIRVSTPQQ
jgi:anti-sigma factor RsiW